MFVSIVSYMAGYVLRSFKIKIEQLACASLLDFPENVGENLGD